MEVKLFEIRDRATMIPALAIKPAYGDGGPTPEQRAFLLRCTGWPPPAPGSPIILMHLRGNARACADPYEWNDRTYLTAHKFIEGHWDDLSDGDLIDVRVLLGEQREPATPGRLGG